jgi:hypothetical protein
VAPAPTAAGEQLRDQIFGDLVRPDRVPLRRLHRVVVGPRREALLPAGAERGTFGGARAEEIANVVGHVERRLDRPVEPLFRGLGFVGAERSSMRLRGVLLVRGAVADVGLAGDERRSRALRDRGLDRLGDLVVVVAVDGLNVPPVRGVSRGHVFGERQGRAAVERNPVVVVKDDQIAQAEMPCER